MRILWQKLMFFWLVLPLAWSEAGSLCSMEWRNNFALRLCLCSSRFLCLKSENCAVELAEQLSPVPPFPPHMSFSWFVRALMFISPGMSSPALSHRFHTFLLANLTVLLPAAESEPGVGESREQCCYCCCCCLLVLLFSDLGCPGGRDSHLSHNKSLTMLDWGELGLRNCLLD